MPHQCVDWPCENTALKQRDGRLLKVLTLDRSFLEQYRNNNPNALIIYRHYFSDDNLNDVAGRCNSIIDSLRGFDDVVDVVETPWNESHEGINNGIADYAQSTIDSVKRIKDAFPNMKVSGGHWSVGTPYDDILHGQFQDWHAWAPALAWIDYQGFHEYDHPSVMQNVNVDANGKATGAYVFRHALVYDWYEQQGLPTPPIILGEFGIDGGGGGKGWRKYGQGIVPYMDDLRTAAPHLIGNRHVLGATIFCVGQEDHTSWGSFDLAGVREFDGLLNEEFMSENPAPTPVKYATNPVTTRVTEFSEWAGNPENKHVPGTQEYLDAFIKNREANAGVETGTYNSMDAINGGFPLEMLRIIEALPKKKK